MSIDKSWTQLPTRLCTEYRGVKAFIQRAQNCVNSNGDMRCPCCDCCNVYWRPVDVVVAHLSDKGMAESYKTTIWNYHGEEAGDNRVDEDTDTRENATIEQNASAPQNDDVHDDLFEMLQDITASNHIQSENPGIEGGHDRTKIPIGGHFEKLFEDLNKSLYSGCETLLVLSFVGTYAY